MWKTRTFKTAAQLQRWIAANGHKFQWQEIAVNNGYGVTFKRLLRVY